ncbi:tripartite tricarboxylate transporter substrate binding protein [Xenophilus arseniciresistens]|uniref:Tripartite tricarboxylate transporter substrate binding protein n=1 Tax=Xenophilus arseniciresistens TaxID=1283306 RepID=A0AAE3SX99_9BURK|nr:tripartite tricarboxylate transporter substrate binding protein [Xenophilus arseniciresistens]MDA7414917.1 tripartite tricarboxylate transporter substrate binding protein [Xenophilus arseniciresistens]
MHASPRLPRRLAIAFGALAACALLGQQAQAQDWPSKSIKLVAPSAPGGPPDAYARAIADLMGKELGQAIVVENSQAVGGMVAAQALTRAEPDGYSLLVGTTGMLTITPHANSKARYTLNDFTPLCEGVGAGLVLASHPSVGKGDFGQLKQWIAAQNPPPTYSSFSPGSPAHFLGHQFSEALKVPMTHVPYRSSPPQVTDMLAGVAPMGFVQIATAAPHIKAGKLSAYATTAPERTVELPNVPTVAELGLPQLQTTVWFGLIGPKGLPPAVAERLIAAHRKALASPEFRTRMVASGLTPSGDRCGAAFKTVMEQDSKRWAGVVKATGFQAD